MDDAVVVAGAVASEIRSSAESIDLAYELENAELLLTYAADSGIEIDSEVRGRVLNARSCQACGRWSLQAAGELLEALTELAVKVRPVTAASIRWCSNDAGVNRTLRIYKRIAIVLAALIVPFSFATFVGSSLSGTIRGDLESANKLAVTTSNNVSPLPQAVTAGSSARGADTPGLRKGVSEALQRGVSEQEAIRDLQEFAATTRSVYAQAKELNWLIFNAVPDPYAGVRADSADRKAVLELPPDLSDLVTATTERVRVYQGIRYFAQTVQSLVATVYGALAACVLPVLYAVLGACAYLLRQFESQVRAKTLTQADGHVAHFVVAAISGGVIGLFSNLNFGQGASISPLALAFLVGYAVDVFFSFLEGMIQSVGRSRAGASTGAGGPVASNR